MIYPFTYQNSKLIETALFELVGTVTIGYFRAVIYSFTYPNSRLGEKALAELDGIVTKKKGYRILQSSDLFLH